MTKVVIAGIGNVLLGDDGVGPFAIKELESQYDLPDNVELADLGTLALDLPVRLGGSAAVILVDSAKFGGAAGDMRLFRKQEILRRPPRAHVDPIAPPLRESISLMESMGQMPRELLLIGMQGCRFEPGAGLSRPVRHCIPHIIDAVLRELRRLDLCYAPKASLKPRGFWWDSLRLRLISKTPLL